MNTQPNTELKPTLRDRFLTPISKTVLDLAAPVLRSLPRGRGVLYGCLGGNRNTPLWNQYGRKTVRGVDHGYTMVLSLGNYFQRETYYQGRYEEWELQALIERVVSPGDVFIDVGANIGMITLYASARVGVNGQVLSFEPNPEARAHLEEHIELNTIRNVRVVPKALSWQRGTLELVLYRSDSGTGTLRPVKDKALRSFAVNVELLDDYAAEVPAGRPLFLKIDTEGYDYNVLRGARAMLSRPNVMVFTEVHLKWLKETGTSAEELFTFMKELGYHAYYTCMGSNGWRRKLSVTPLSLPGPHHWFNALFVRPDHLRHEHLFAGWANSRDRLL